MKKTILQLLSLCSLVFTSATQAQPTLIPDGELYIKSVVPRVDILVNPDTLNWIYENVESDQEFHAVFVFDNGNLHDTIRDIGFRLRGNTSRYSAKKSFKVSFNTWVEGRKYHGVEKMNLNGEHNDPSVSRARLYWDILRQSQIAGARFNHVQVFINGNYYGLYLNCEHIDEEFVEKYFGNNDGNLYKCLYPADLTYKGQNPDLYKFMSGDHRTYELKTNEEQDDYSDLAHFIDVLNNTPAGSLACELEKIFNVQDYLKIAAIDVLTANWDGYIFNKNNFYLYKNTATGLFEYIPYDTDNTFGIDWFGIDWASRDIYNWANASESRPLFTKLMQVPGYRAAYTYYLKQIISNITGTQNFTDAIIQLKQQLAPYVSNDPFYPLDYGYSISSFNSSFNEGTGAHVPIGILPFIQTRNSIALAQADNTGTSPVIRYIYNNRPGVGQDFIVRAFAEDENLNSVQLVYKTGNGEWQQTAMADNGQSGDFAAGDGFYGAVLPGMNANTVIAYKVKAGDTGNHFTEIPCTPVEYTIPYGNAFNLFINEFMASNNTTITDDFNEYEDWIELFNGGSQAVWLGDKYLTDNKANPQKWALPDLSMEPGTFLLLWADDQPGQGPLHTNYKLDKDSEEIALFDNEASGYALLDFIAYDNQATDISTGRINDASPEWKTFSLPTPGSTNSLVGIEETKAPEFRFWPNPSSGGKLWFEKKTSVNITDLTGRIRLMLTECTEADVSSLPSGIYLLRTGEGSTSKLVIQK